MSDRLDVGEFLSGYLVEAEENLAAASTHLLAVEDALRRGAHDPRAVRVLYRSLHTLKGLSAMIGAEPIVDIAHEMESLLRAGDRAGGRLTAAAVDVLLRGVRAIEERVAQLARGEDLTPAPRPLVEELATHLDVVAVVGPSPLALLVEPDLLARLSAGEREELLQGITAGRRAVRVEFHPSAERAEVGLTITLVRERVAALGDLVKVWPRSVPAGEGRPGICFVLVLLTRAEDDAIAAAAGAEVGSVVNLVAGLPPGGAPEPFDAGAGVELHRPNIVRVEVSRLDDALERLAALVVGRGRLQRAADALSAKGADVRELAVILREHGAQLRALRAAIMSARMVRIGELLERAPLIVRGLGKSSGKPVRLTIEACEAELDKAVAERLLPVLVHLLRNAVDHAIEPADERARAGKPIEGHLVIACFERPGSRLELRLTDDGGGIDREAVARRAGAPVPGTAQQLLDLIVRPGFSTLDAATHTSGRGLGMEIVKRIVVDELGGSMSLETTPGKGTTFTLLVPLSVTILDAFAFACGTETFVVPASVVDELAEVDTTAVMAAPLLRGGNAPARMFRHRESELPLYGLGALLGVAASSEARPKAILVRDGHGTVAFEVDRMLGRQEIVVRPIVDRLARVAGIAGTTDLGDGRPTLVLDLVALLPTRATAKEAS